MSIDSTWGDFESFLHNSDNVHNVIYSEFDNTIKTNKQPEIKHQKKDYRTCPNCQILCLMKENAMECSKCGWSKKLYTMAEDHFSISLNTDHTVKSGFTNFRVVGAGAGRYNKALLRTSASYDKYREMNNFKTLNNAINRSDKDKVPKITIKLAIHLFELAKKPGRVYRTSSKSGIISACLYYACREHGVSKTSNEIASLLNVNDCFHSQGDRILHKLREDGVLDIPSIDIDPTKDYLKTYFHRLNISAKYLPFSIELIQHAKKHKIDEIHIFKTNTKCAGVIYTLVRQIKALKKNITPDDIKIACRISIPTFKKYNKMINQYPGYFRKIFKKHRIPMPSFWRKQ